MIHIRIKDNEVYHDHVGAACFPIEWPCSICAVLSVAWRVKAVSCASCVLDQTDDFDGAVGFLRSLDA